MKIRGGPNNIVPPYGMGVPGAVYNPTYAYGHGAFHAPFHAPVNFPYGYNYNPYHGYGWHG